MNGLALQDGKIKYVTALGETDTGGGWRKNKRDGGILMDVPKNQVLIRGLSMPHSFNSYVLPDAALKDVVPPRPTPPAEPEQAYTSEPSGNAS